MSQIRQIGRVPKLEEGREGSRKSEERKFQEPSGRSRNKGARASKPEDRRGSSRLREAEEGKGREDRAEMGQPE
jgi:hypothetical protein